MRKITIFTPTYNRADKLINLYQSLMNQTCNNFTWLIVDDGSTDKTEDVVSEWIFENQIEISYYKQENYGKAFAHNVGVSLTKTELFTCVDSDDYLSTNAVEEIINYWDKIEDESVVGIVALKKNISVQTVPMLLNENKSTLKDIYNKQKYKGELMLIYKSEILSKYSFPIIQDEKFVPESYLYDLMDKEGYLKPLNKILYFFEYYEDGYTMNMIKLILKNHLGYKLFLMNRIKESKRFEVISYILRLDSINIATKSVYSYESLKLQIFSLLLKPLSYILFAIKYKKAIGK